ncbi:MAG: hypothetical protein QOI12_3615 [Alphaproteobacteria bacterium]|jgi:hypothetical protein|nr:hypothetical protein [Alphaproteobacteria bacterium]
MKVPSFGSNRRFGLLFGLVCLAVFGWGRWHGSGRIGWLVAAVVLLLIAVAMPRILDPLKRLWLKAGGFLHVLVSPVLLAGFYYVGVTPIGLLMRLLGKDPLRRKPGHGTYWVERRPPGPDPQTMPELF